MDVRMEDPLESGDGQFWYKDVIIYQVHVKAFKDSNGDGIGDFRGLTEKLDYIQDLGVTAIWLLPFYPSPLRDDGYDTADYTAVHEKYGTMAEARRFVREAHRRGLKVITELVINHTSDQHAWFQRARNAKPGSVYRDFYVWSDTPDKYQQARIIFQDFEGSNWSWDGKAGAYYWHRFYHHQPDLNFDNPRVHDAVIRAMDFWLKLGVDGLRLDAIPYLYEREGTNCENLPETHAFLKKLRAHVDANYQDRMLLAEANQWPEDAVEYFGDGDECHMAFHFPVMPRLYMALRMEDHYPIIDILEQTPEIPPTSQWAMFLRNHDELTLEMVTDEERDYMYRSYASDPEARVNLGIRRRLANLMDNNRRRIELLNGLLFSLPGTPVIYYGDEIGMGDNIYLGDRDSVRTPMQWSSGTNAGFSDANRQRLYLPINVDPEFHYETVNVDIQRRNPQSLLWWMKRLIDLRKRHTAFGRGTLEMLNISNRKVIAFVRAHEDERILVVANLSRFAQAVELDLSDYNGMRPVELFGRSEFPLVGDLPYFITVGPHGFYWFSLEQPRVTGEVEFEGLDGPRAVPEMAVTGSWQEITTTRRRQLLAVLPGYLRERRWFASKARTIRRVAIDESIPVRFDGGQALVLIIGVEYTEGDPERYLLPLTWATDERARQVEEWIPHSVLSHLKTRDGQGVLYDAIWEPEFCLELLDVIGRRRTLRNESSRVQGRRTRAYRRLRGATGEPLNVQIKAGEQSNSSVIFGERLIMKVFRKIDVGINPDLEIGRFLTAHSNFKAVASVAGSLELEVSGRRSSTLAILQEFVPNDGDAWSYALDVLGGYIEELLATEDVDGEMELPDGHLLDYVDAAIPEEVYGRIGPFLGDAHLLGQRTGELHLALTQGVTDEAFRPEAFSLLGQRALYQSLRTHLRQVFQLARRSLDRAPEAMQEDVRQVLGLQAEILQSYRAITDHLIDAMNTRHHGDLHLGQVLYTGRDFVIIDFEGEPARPVSERRLKRSPLRDLAGMVRSFHYAAYANLFERGVGSPVREEDLPRIQNWVEYWSFWVSVAYMQGYLEEADGADYLPSQREDLRTLLDAFLLEKAVYELGYELNNRPAWTQIPVRGIRRLLGVSS